MHEALECLYDNVRLSQGAVVECFPSLRSISPVGERAEATRSALLEAIESLRPPRRVPFGALESRSYDALTLRYVEGMSIESMEGELSVGRRQIYRDLEVAETSLAQVLTSWAQSGLEPPAEDGGTDSLSDELTALASDPDRVDLFEVLREAVAVVRPLADLSGVTVADSRSAKPVFALADRAILRQVLIQTLSSAVQAAAGTVELGAATGSDLGAEVTARFSGSVKGPHERRLLDARRIAESQGMSCEWAESDGRVALTLTVATGSPVRVLVVEDNPGAVELYRRYLSSRSWQLQAVGDPRLAFDVARRLRPISSFWTS